MLKARETVLNFLIHSAEGQRRGTKIVIGLKEDFMNGKENRIKDIIKKYSAFVQFPVSVNGEKVNTVDAIWMRSKKRDQGRGIRGIPINFSPMIMRLP